MKRRGAERGHVARLQEVSFQAGSDVDAQERGKQYFIYIYIDRCNIHSAKQINDMTSMLAKLDINLMMWRLC